LWFPFSEFRTKIISKYFIIYSERDDPDVVESLGKKVRGAHSNSIRGESNMIKGNSSFNAIKGKQNSARGNANGVFGHKNSVEGSGNLIGDTR
jgi:hypothetical protein